MDIVTKINNLHKEDNHAEIIKLLENYKIPLDYELTCLLARAYYNVSLESNNQDNYQKGIKLLLSVKEDGKNDPLWHYRAGYGYFHTDQEEKALSHFNKAVSLIPKTKEEIAKWRDSDLGSYISECEDIIKAKEVSSKFDDYENINKDIITDFILYNLLHRIFPKDDIVTDNTIYIPEWMLVIKPVIQNFTNDRIDIEWVITCPLFDYGIREESFGAGDNLKEACRMAVGIFASSLLQTVNNTLMNNNKNKIKYSSTFNENTHNWDIYYNSPLITNDENLEKYITDFYFWDIISDKLKNYIGNQKMVCIKIYTAKFAGSLVVECRIDDVYITDLSDTIEEYMTAENINSQFFACKQYFIAIQHEDTLLPYKYADKEGYINLRNSIKTICSIIYDMDLEEMQQEQDEDSLFNLLEELNSKVDDFTLCIEAVIFIPEIFAANVYDNINFPEYMMLSFNDDDPMLIYLTQLNDYNRIYRAVWDIFDNFEDITKRDTLYNKFINMSITISGLLMEGKELDNNDDTIIMPAFDLELNADERFEIR